MAKTYKFYVKLQRAEPSFMGGVEIHFGGSDTVYAQETVECTLAEVLERRKALSAQEPRMHVAFIGMANRHDRKPPGFDKATGEYTVGGRAPVAA